MEFECVTRMYSTGIVKNFRSNYCTSKRNIYDEQWADQFYITLANIKG